MINRSDWNGLNHKVIRERTDELVTSDDYIPVHLRTYIDMQERNKYLESKGLLAEIIKQRKEKRQEFKESNDKVEWHIQEILDFINNNPVFEDFIKIKGRRYTNQ